MTLFLGVTAGTRVLMCTPVKGYLNRGAHYGVSLVVPAQRRKPQLLLHRRHLLHSPKSCSENALNEADTCTGATQGVR